MNQPKLYILTGFLGSGKTTLLLNLLHHLKGHKVGVIQNEFGKLSIDGDILRSGDIQMVEITRGSIFCTCLQLKFVEALSEMAKQDFEYLFVESSGLGDPSNVQSILDAAEIAAGKKMDFRGVICLVDAKNFWEQINDGDYVNRQLRHCHLAAITKGKLAGGTGLKVAERDCENPQKAPGSVSHVEFYSKSAFKYAMAPGSGGSGPFPPGAGCDRPGRGQHPLFPL